MLKNVFFLSLLLFLVVSCANEKEVKEDILVSVGGEQLSRKEVVDNIEKKLQPTDSIKQADAYVRNWIENRLLKQVALRNIPDMSAIDRLVDEYRTTLIIYEYRRQLMLQNDTIYSIPESVMQAFYEHNSSEFVLTEPYVEGLMLRVPASHKDLKSIKSLLNHSNVKVYIDKIEKLALDETIVYYYFGDEWTRLKDVISRFPASLENADNFVKTNKTYELSDNGFVYLLNFFELRNVGDIMPYPVAKPQIKEKYVNINQRQFDKELKKHLYDDALSSGDIKFYIDKTY